MSELDIVICIVGIAVVAALILAVSHGIKAIICSLFGIDKDKDADDKKP